MSTEKGRHNLQTPSRATMAFCFYVGHIMGRSLSLSAILLVAATAAAQNGKKLLTVEEIFGSGKFALKGLSSVQWIDGGGKFSYIETDTVTRVRSVYTYTVANGNREMVMDGSLLVPRSGERPMRIGSYQWSQDGEKILVTGALPARRTKSGGYFGIFDVGRKTFRLLSNSAGEYSIIKLSPDGRKVGYVRDNNLYVMNLESEIETRLTADGSETILNGVFDWVYEEEFSIIDAWQWSPDSRRVAFWRLDQSNVPTFPLVSYPHDDGYPIIQQMRYPKAGEQNSLVAIGIADIETGQTTWVDLGANTDMYVPRIQWTGDPQVLAVQRLNRAQDTLEVLLASAKDGSTRRVLLESDTAWIDVRDDLKFLERSSQFVWTSNRDGFSHIYLYSNDGSVVRQVTRGDWEVTNIVHVNERRKTIYFLATEAGPVERHLYSVRFDGTGLRRLCRDAGWHSINFSPEGLVYIDSYSTAASPTVISLRSNDGTRVAPLVENKREMFRDYSLGPLSFFEVPTGDGERLNAFMIRPAEFDSTKRYPVLMYVYGGPGSQTVTNSWGGSRYLWHQSLVSKGYIVVSVDNRGTGGRGKAFMQVTNRRLGIRETADYIATARYLSSLSFLDSTRIGIWGWSGGGYYTCMAMTLGAEYFKTGIAVAAVTDFRYYDTIWAERYMGTPVNNPDGYRESSAVTHAGKLKGNLLLIHGLSDDNVHWQNAVVFVDEVIKQGKQVDTMFYPGRAHGISGASLHLYTLMTKYILERL
jgi:dipeptidyl-peptidase-4